MRALVLFGVVVGALVALLWARPAMVLGGEPPRLTYLTTAHQLGIIGYRDPAGVISPDASRIAYTEGRFIRVLPIGGGVPQTLPAGEGQIRYLAWAGNQVLVAEDTGAPIRWQTYTFTADGVVRKPLWDGQDVNHLRQPAWSADAKSMVALATGKEGAELWRISAAGTTRVCARRSPAALRRRRGRHRERLPASPTKVDRRACRFPAARPHCASSPIST